MRSRLAALASLFITTIPMNLPHALGQVRSAPAGNSLPQPTPQDTQAVFPHADQPHASLTRAQHTRFAQGIDLDGFRKLAVFHGGRAKIIDTLARETLTRIYGKPYWQDIETKTRYDPVFTYLDLLFNKTYYHDKPILYVEVLALRRLLVDAVIQEADQRERWLRIGRLTPKMLATPQAGQRVVSLDGDLRMHQAIRQLRTATSAFQNTASGLYMVSPLPGTDQWSHLLDLAATPSVSANTNNPDTAVNLIQAVDAPNVAPTANHQLAGTVLAQLNALRHAWRSADPAEVNASLTQLTHSIPRLNPTSYPAAWLREAESLYNATGRFTVGYGAYFLSTLTLLIAMGTQRRTLAGLGVGLLAIGFATHTVSIIVRMLLAGRWPIHNQFESFMAISWFAALVGLVLMAIRKQWLFGAAAAALGGCALLLANTVPIPSNDVGQVAGILATSRILYLHVNLVLASYGLIALGFFVSLFYLVAHYNRAWPTARLATAGLGTSTPPSAEASPQVSPAHTTPPPVGRHRLLGDLDQAQMVVLQLAFWLLGVGILLGAYWADHAWGRWWAWDPKEAWALITWIVYLIVIHIRFGVKNRGLTTAWLSVLGFFVMLWTYWGVNLLLAGLHSYA